MSARKETTRLLQFKLPLNQETKSACQICGNRFQKVVNKERQCKQCMRIVCENCITGNIKIYYADGHASISRCCSLCVKEDGVLSNLVKQNNLVFGQDSSVGEQWVKKINKEKMSYSEILKQYNDKMFQTNKNTIKFKSESARLMEELFPSLNYSLRQFIGRMIEKLQTTVVNDKIVNIMVAVYAYFKDLPYIYELLYVIFFLSCFCNQFHCYFIVTRFIDKIYPQYLRIENLKKDNLLSHELKILIDMYKLLIKKIEKEELDIIAMYLQTRFTHLIKAFTINTTKASLSFYIIDQTLKNGSYIYLYKNISSLLFHSRQLLQEWQEPTIIELNFLKQVSVEQLKSSMITFQKSNIKFQMEHEFFDSAEHRKLHEKYKQLESMYQKSEQKYRLLDSKYKVLVNDYQKAALKLMENNTKIMSLQQELLSYADKLVLLDETQKYKNENEILSKRNAYINEEMSLLRKSLQDLQKKYMMEDAKIRIFQKVREDYERELVDLKTKNQIHEIQKMANDISFNTSFIEQRIEVKNKRISELEAINNENMIELNFYRNSRPGTYLPQTQKTDSFFNANVSVIRQKNNMDDSYRMMNGGNNTLNLTSLQISTKEEKDTFKKYMQMSKQMVDKLKLQLSQCSKSKQQLTKEVNQLRKTVQNQKKQLQLSQQISNFMNQIPEELNYSLSIRDLQNIIAKQTNLHRKTQFQGVLTNFKKCMYEVRYRTIDAKLKQKKINQLQANLKNTGKQQEIQQKIAAKQTVTTSQSLKTTDQMLEWVGNESALKLSNQSLIKKQQCIVM